MTRSASQLHPISEAWEWQLLGRCRDRSTAQFFHPDDDLGRISRRMRESAAKRLCDSCPVRRQCATHALNVGEEYGVWGGFSEHDRSLLRQLGWRDALDGRVADVAKLDRRLARVRRERQEEKDRRDQGRARQDERSTLSERVGHNERGRPADRATRSDRVSHTERVEQHERVGAGRAS